MYFIILIECPRICRVKAEGLTWAGKDEAPRPSDSIDDTLDLKKNTRKEYHGFCQLVLGQNQAGQNHGHQLDKFQRNRPTQLGGLFADSAVDLDGASGVESQQFCNRYSCSTIGGIGAGSVINIFAQESLK